MSADAASTSNQRGGTKGKREPNNVVQVTDGDDDETTVKFEALKRRVVGIMGVEAVKRENEDGGVFEAWFQGRCLGTSAGATDEDLWWAIDLSDEAVRRWYYSEIDVGLEDDDSEIYDEGSSSGDLELRMPISQVNHKE